MRSPTLPLTTPLTTSTARDHGLTAWTLARSGLVSPHRGLWAAREATSLREAARDAGAVIKGRWAVCGWDAVELHGLPTRSSWRPGDAVHVCVPTESGRVRRPGIVAQRGLERRRVVAVDGLPVVSGIWAVADAAADPTTTHGQLVRLCDGYLHLGGHPDTLIALACTRRRGVTALRAALADVRRGAESPRETDLRLLLAVAGLPAPELQVRLRDETGRVVCRFDLYWEEFALGGEFDGDGHRTDRARWRTDRAADRRALLLGHRRLRVTSDDLLPHRRAETVQAFRSLMVAPTHPVRGLLERTVDPRPLDLPW